MRARLQASLALPFLILAIAGPAAADEAKPDYATAKKHFKAGQQMLHSDRYGEAVVEFKKAYEITKDGLVMGQVAQAYAKAGDFENALASIRIYRDSLPQGERASADTLAAEYEKAVKEGRSKHLVLPGEEPAKPAEAQPAGGGTPPPTTPEEPPRRRKRLWTWVAAGAAGALGLTALVLGLNAQSKYDELSDKCGNSCHEYESDIDSIRTRAVATDVLWGFAAAAAVTSVVLFFVEGRTPRRAGEIPDEPTGGEPEEELSRFRLSPVVGGGRFGINAGLQF